ncbi:MAG: hypothetical protein ABH877_02060 [bacterium]
MKRVSGQALTIVAALAAAFSVSGCDGASPTDPSLTAEYARMPAGGYSYSVVGIPNATATQIFRMNARGAMVGSYTQAGVTRGFLLWKGDLQTIEFPGAAHTYARGINERGDIVGFYSLAGIHGYVLTGDGFTTLDAPAAVGTRLWDINARGEISGEYQASPGEQWRGFTWREGEFTFLDVPGANMSAGYGINEAGEVVGHYTMPATGTKMFGFKLGKDGAFTHFNHPDSGTKMSCNQGIGVHGEAVGHYGVDGSSNVYGYLWAKGDYIATLQVPGATQTFPLSITPSGLIAGYHWDATANNWRGFVATPLNPAGR